MKPRLRITRNNSLIINKTMVKKTGVLVTFVSLMFVMAACGDSAEKSGANKVSIKPVAAEKISGDNISTAETEKSGGNKVSTKVGPAVNAQLRTNVENESKATDSSKGSVKGFVRSASSVSGLSNGNNCTTNITIIKGPVPKNITGSSLVIPEIPSLLQPFYRGTINRLRGNQVLTAEEAKFLLSGTGTYNGNCEGLFTRLGEAIKNGQMTDREASAINALLRENNLPAIKTISTSKK